MSDFPTSAKCVVIGAGIVGNCLVGHLARLGWTDLVLDTLHPIFDGVSSGDHAYFVHSFQFHVSDPATRLAHVDYGGDVTAAVGRDNMVGLQFHPEKSQRLGRRVLENFLALPPC